MHMHRQGLLTRPDSLRKRPAGRLIRAFGGRRSPLPMLQHRYGPSSYPKTLIRRLYESLSARLGIRAVSTAEIIGTALGRPLSTLPDLCEHKRDGASRPQSDQAFLALLARFFDHPDELIFGTETASEALVRFTAALRHVLAQEPKDVIVVGHGTVLSLYLGAIDLFPRI